MGDPGSETWPSEEAMKHGGGMTWLTPTYDPELNLIYVPTGNPQPVIAGKARPGANLFTASIVALNPDTGKMQWYFQSSPHDTHDWDATQTPVLFDGEINGQKRKLVAQASRNGYFFVLDRATGKNISSTEYVKINWSKGVDAKGSPIPNPAKEPQLDGALVSPNQGGGTNWPPPTYNPDTGLFYVSASRAFSVYYIYDPSDKPEGWGGNDRGGWGETMIQAIDYKTGKVKWTHKWEDGGRSGLLSTAGKLLFAGDGSGNLVALDAANGNPLWHANLGNSVTNGPITYELDGTQYLVVAAGDTCSASRCCGRRSGQSSQALLGGPWYTLNQGMLEGKNYRRWVRSFVAASLAVLFSFASLTPLAAGAFTPSRAARAKTKCCCRKAHGTDGPAISEPLLPVRMRTHHARRQRDYGLRAASHRTIVAGDCGCGPRTPHRILRAPTSSCRQSPAAPATLTSARIVAE